MNTDSNRDGPIIATIETIINWVGKWSSIICLFYRPTDYTPEEISKGYQRRAVVRVDKVIAIWWIVILLSYLALYAQTRILWEIALVLVIIRVVNILSYNLRVALIYTSLPGQPGKVEIVSIRRSLIFGIINFIELSVCFAGVYARYFEKLRLPDGEARHFATYLYFSCITQLTIGYGDISPLGWLRLIVSIQALAGLLLITVTIARFVGMLRIDELPDSK